jgi:hypothetical protein
MDDALKRRSSECLMSTILIRISDNEGNKHVKASLLPTSLANALESMPCPQMEGNNIKRDQ